LAISLGKVFGARKFFALTVLTMPISWVIEHTDVRADFLAILVAIVVVQLLIFGVIQKKYPAPYWIGLIFICLWRALIIKI
jgi:hypothetical protein